MQIAEEKYPVDAESRLTGLRFPANLLSQEMMLQFCSLSKQRKFFKKKNKQMEDDEKSKGSLSLFP